MMKTKRGNVHPYHEGTQSVTLNLNASPGLIHFLSS